MRVLVTGALLLVLAGCGAAADDGGVATAGGAGSDTASAEKLSEQDAALAFATCMRENGVPDFPDPEISPNGELMLSLPQGVDPKTVDAAQDACREHLPNGGEPKQLSQEDLAAQRAYSQCMRDNGVPKFPDPGPNGGIAIEGGPGLDPRSGVFKAAEEKCAATLPDGAGGRSTHDEGGE